MTMGTQEGGMHAFGVSHWNAVARYAIMIAACFFLQACASASADNTATAVSTTPGPRDTATFPNLNIPPTPAAEQISDTEKAETTRALTEARKRATSQNTAAPRSQAAELRRLARSHGSDALKLIEADQ